MPEPYYATVKQLREKVKVEDEEVLSDAEAVQILTEAEDLIDDRLLARPIDPDTGRKVVLGDFQNETWRTDKLREATLGIAQAIFEDPGVTTRQRARFESGDVSSNGFFGGAFGERVDALLTASGLRVNTTRVSRGRRYRLGWIR
jgi:hypothetical protein